MLTIKHAQGSNGPTSVRAEGTMEMGHPDAMRPWTCEIELTDLELDQRLRERTPIEYDELWDVFKPSGRVNAEVHLVRGQTTNRWN